MVTTQGNTITNGSNIRKYHQNRQQHSEITLQTVTTQGDTIRICSSIRKQQCKRLQHRKITLQTVATQGDTIRIGSSIGKWHYKRQQHYGNNIKTGSSIMEITLKPVAAQDKAFFWQQHRETSIQKLKFYEVDIVIS